MQNRQNGLLRIETNPQSAVPLELALVVDRAVVRGQPISARLIASGGTGGYVYALVDSDLPVGCDGPDPVTGEITGTPTLIGRTDFTATVQDSSATALPPEAFAINVVTSLTARDVRPVVGEVGIAYSYQLRVYGATGAVVWTVASGDLPAGLTLSTSGLLSGMPAEPHGITYFTVHAEDAGTGDPFDAEIAVTIAAPLANVYPSPQLDVMARVPTTIDLTPMFKDGVPPYTATPLNGIPDGMQVAKIDGKDSTRWGIIGTPTVNPPHADDENRIVGVTIRDALGATTDIALQLMIRNPVNSLGSLLDGIGAGPNTAPKVNWKGAFVRGVTPESDQSQTTIDIGFTMPAGSVLARSTGAGDPVAMAAPLNTVLCNPAFGVFGWSKVTQLMLSATAAASSARVYGGGGDWVNSVTGSWSATSYLVSGTQVLGARKVGWAAATGTATRTTFATTSVTLPQLAERVKALIDDLIAHGLIGA